MTDRPRQANLFGDPPPRRRRESGVGPAEVPQDLARAATRIPGSVRFGTSSWSFPGWAGIVWDREASASTLARRGLAAYARHPLLRTVGVDRTFYAPVDAATLRRYAEDVPDDFRFVVKMPAAVTSPYRLSGGGAPRESNPDWLDADLASATSVAPFVEGLGARAGVLVAQFPPLGRAAREPARFLDRLGSLLERIAGEATVAVELRDRDLLGAAYRDVLERTGATHCVSVHPRMPDVPTQLAFARPGRPLVVRWMLHAGLDYEGARERYAPFDRLVDEDAGTRESLAEAIEGAVDAARDVYVVANNKAEGSAPKTVFRLAKSVASRLERA